MSVSLAVKNVLANLVQTSPKWFWPRSNVTGVMEGKFSVTGVTCLNQRTACHNLNLEAGMSLALDRCVIGREGQYKGT
jgi:hypothetical protein